MTTESVLIGLKHISKNVRLATFGKARRRVKVASKMLLILANPCLASNDVIVEIKAQGVTVNVVSIELVSAANQLEVVVLGTTASCVTNISYLS
jgi:hypothetical protein